MNLVETMEVVRNSQILEIFFGVELFANGVNMKYEKEEK